MASHYGSIEQDEQDEDSRENQRRNLEGSTDFDPIPTSIIYHISSSVSQRVYQLLFSDLMLKFFTCIFLGILPCAIVRCRGRKKFMSISFVIIVLQWFSFATYIFCVKHFWSTKGTYFIKGHDNIHFATTVILLGLSLSGAVTTSLMVYYFHKQKHDFRERLLDNGHKIRLIPKFHFHLQGMDEDPDRIGPDANDWLLTNSLLVIGLIVIVFVIVTDFYFNIFYDFEGLHDFLTILHNVGEDEFYRWQYIIAVTTFYWGCCATVCTCCVFFVMSRDVVRHINYVQRFIMANARTKRDLVAYHDVLYKYTQAMTKSLSLWFVVHSVVFIVLVAAIIYEWFKMVERNPERNTNTATAKSEKIDYDYEMRLLALVTGTLLITYKFVFPFFAASNITSTFIRFYTKLARRCAVENTLDFSLLSSQVGFTVLGIRITHMFAIVSVFGSVIGALKFLLTPSKGG